MKTVAMIQARVGSTRLPAKVLLDLEGKSVIERVVERVRASKLVDEVVVATTVSKGDLKLVEICSRSGISVFCGSEDDVLDRFYQAARLFGADHIVRITADCPLIDPAIIDRTIEHYMKTNSDYTSSQMEEKLPDGEDVEVFSFNALKKAWQEAKLASQREHVTPYIRNNPKIFKLSGLIVDEDHSDKRWTLDNKEDYEFIKTVYSRLYNKNPLFGLGELLALLTNEPELEKINGHIARNEGYAKSLREDKVVEVESR